jgi:hypothetical protein
VGVDGHTPGADFRAKGFDSTLAFEPQLGVLPDYMEDGPTWAKMARNTRLGILSARLKVYDELEARNLMGERDRTFPFLRTVFVGWDNTPRRGRNAIILVNSRPGSFEAALVRAIECGSRDGHDFPVFINAWNEWAEGNYLEPDQRYGLEYLMTVRRLAASSLEPPPDPRRPPTPQRLRTP